MWNEQEVYTEGIHKAIHSNNVESRELNTISLPGSINHGNVVAEFSKSGHFIADVLLPSKQT